VLWCAVWKQIGHVELRAVPSCDRVMDVTEPGIDEACARAIGRPPARVLEREITLDHADDGRPGMRVPSGVRAGGQTDVLDVRVESARRASDPPERRLRDVRDVVVCDKEPGRDGRRVDLRNVRRDRTPTKPRTRDVATARSNLGLMAASFPYRWGRRNRLTPRQPKLPPLAGWGAARRPPGK
jgi:hypothetical protein